MSTGRSWWYLLPRPVRRLPADLAAVVALTLLTVGSVFVPVVNETPLRVVFGLAFVLFLPGYAFIAALFPETGASPVETGTDGTAATSPSDERTDDSPGEAERTGEPAPVPGTSAAEAAAEPSGRGDDTGLADRIGTTGDRAGIDGIERVALSFGLSIAIVPLLGLVLNFTPWGIRLVPIVVTVAGFTLVSTAVAARRRWALPPDERFVVPYRDWLAAGQAELFAPESRTDAALNVLLAVSVLLAVASVGYAVAVPQQGERFTEFYLLTEGADGDLVADGYPQEMVAGESAELVVGIGNQEYATTNYTVVIQLQTVEIEGNESTVLERTELDRFEATLEHNTTRHRRYDLSATRTGEDLRAAFLLYRGDAPAEPTRETAYRSLHLWIDVYESAASAEAARDDEETSGDVEGGAE